MYLQDGWSALMLASQNGHTEVVKCLIEANSLANLQANVSCNSVVIKSLVRIMISANVIHILHFISFYFQTFFCQDKLLYFESPLSLYYHTTYLQNGYSALMLASGSGHMQVVKCLIEANSAVDLQESVSCNSVLTKKKKKKLIRIMMSANVFHKLHFISFYFQTFYCNDKI